MIELQVVIPALTDLLKEEERDILRLVTEGTASRMVVLINEPKSGKSYPRGKKTHIASAPGQAPANDSSNLSTSIMPNVNELQGEINLAEYGLYLEFGTNRIAPRPFVIPSLEEILQSL